MANNAGGILPKGIPTGQAKFNVGIAGHCRKTGRGIDRIRVESAKIFVQDLNLGYDLLVRNVPDIRFVLIDNVNHHRDGVQGPR